MCQLKLLKPNWLHKLRFEMSGSVFSHAQENAGCPPGLLLLSRSFLSSN